MVTLNNRLVSELVKELEHTTGNPKFLRTFVLECNEAVPLSWSITQPNREKLNAALSSPKMQSEVKCLARFLEGEPCPACNAQGE